MISRGLSIRGAEPATGSVGADDPHSRLHFALFLNGYHDGNATPDFRLPVTPGPSGATEVKSSGHPAVHLPGIAVFFLLGRSGGQADRAE